MHAAADAVRPLRERMADILGAPTTVQEWEIAVLHRRKPADAGACARVSWLRGEPRDVDGAIDMYRTQVLSGLDDLPGFCSASLLVDRASGRSVSSVAYESREMLDASRQGADELRSRAVQQIRAQILEVAEFELVLSELRVLRRSEPFSDVRRRAPGHAGPPLAVRSGVEVGLQLGGDRFGEHGECVDVPVRPVPRRVAGHAHRPEHVSSRVGEHDPEVRADLS